MTAADRGRSDPSEPLLVGASPRDVSRSLLPEDRARFAEEYESALDQARRSYELGGVHEVVERWRQVAVLQSDPVGFRRAVRTVAEIATGEPSPEGEPFEVTRLKAGM